VSIHSPGPKKRRKIVAKGGKKKRVKRTKEERKQRRREKQRVIARNFRKRKKAHLENLQEEVKRLRLENEELRKELGMEKENESAFGSSMRATKEQLSALSTLLETGDDGAAVRKIVVATKPSKGEEERKLNSVNFHFDQLKKHLVLDDFAKMIVLALDGDEEKTTETWNIMCEALSLTPNQKIKMQKMRNQVSKRFLEISTFRREFDVTTKAFHESVQSLKDLVGDVTSALTPTQEAKHLMWRDQNKACLQMMSCMWKMKVGSFSK